MAHFSLPPIGEACVFCGLQVTTKRQSKRHFQCAARAAKMARNAERTRVFGPRNDNGLDGGTLSEHRQAVRLAVVQHGIMR